MVILQVHIYRIGVYLAAVALRKEPIEPLVAEALDHRECVILHITDIVMLGIALSRAAIEEAQRRGLPGTARCG